MEHWIKFTVREDDIDDSLYSIYNNEMLTSWWDPIDIQSPTNKWNIIDNYAGFWGGWYDIFLVGLLSSVILFIFLLFILI